MSSQISSSRRIVFMGTPEFAAVCLENLYENEFNIVGVVTIPDKKIGRGLKTQFSAVKEYAVKANIPVLQPEKLKEPVFLQELEKLNADLFIVIAFRMLPKEVWKMPALGTFNLHASLLPKYRGAAPIQRAIWNGEKETGVTTFLLDDKIDTGSILYQEKVSIDATDNAGSLHDKLLRLGSDLVIKTAEAIFSENINPIPQITENENLPLAPKIFKTDCYIDWNKSAEEIILQIRALSPYPGAIASLKLPDNGVFITFKVFDAKISNNLSTSYKQGYWTSDGRNFLDITCNDGKSISLLKVQLPGKKTLTITEFLRGFRLPNPENAVFTLPSI